MKKLILLIAGVLVVAGTAMAHCGSCGADAKDAEKKAACSVKSAEDKAACAVKSAEDKAACTKKDACEMKKNCKADCDKPCCAAKAEQAPESSKKWWKLWGNK